jgi:hypothetical protein
LSPGDWDVWGQIVFIPGTAPTALAAGVSTTSATLPTAAQLAQGQGAMIQLRATFTSSVGATLQTGTTRINVSTPITVYLVAQITGTGSWTATGFISARRAR